MLKRLSLYLTLVVIAPFVAAESDKSNCPHVVAGETPGAAGAVRCFSDTCEGRDRSIATIRLEVTSE